MPRNIRQAEIIPQLELERTAAVIVGCGAIGSWLASFLAHTGVPFLMLVDPDRVASENLALQGYYEQDLDQYKAEALARRVLAVHAAIDVVPLPSRFRKDMLAHVPAMYDRRAVFVCVDNIDVRRFVYGAARHWCHLFVDGRMTAFVWRVITVDSWPDDYYEKTLFRHDEAYVERCTARGTVGSASDPANKMYLQFVHWLRGSRVCDGTLARDMEFNQLAMTFEAHFDSSAEVRPAPDPLFASRR